jgi:hypothetical protein
VDWFIKIGTWLEALSFMAIVSEYTAAGGVYATIESYQVPTGYDWVAPTSNFVCQQPESKASLLFTQRIPQRVPLRPFINSNLSGIGKLWDVVALAAVNPKMLKGLKI